MQAAANRSAAPSGVRSAVHNEDPFRALADDGALLDALPIAAGVFGLKEDKLWVHSLNHRFYELAGCAGDTEAFPETFHRFADGPAGDFVRMANPPWGRRTERS